MVLTKLQIKFRYPQLEKRLKTEEHGTVFSHLTFLKKLGVQVQIAESNDYDNIDLLTRTLEHGQPLIVSVETAELQTYWNKNTNHAVVVVGISDESVMVNDPAFDEAPKVVPLDEFLIAWGEQDYRYAILTKS